MTVAREKSYSRTEPMCPKNSPPRGRAMKEGPNTASMDRSEIVRLSLGKNSADMRAAQ